MRIGLAQINSTVGGFEENFEKIRGYIDQAKRRKLNIIVFPELALCGYPPQDLLFKRSFLKANLFYLNKLKKHLKGELLAIVGYASQKKGRLFNSLAVLSKDKIIDIYSKIHLPNYGVFGQKRYFTASQEAKLYLYKNFKIILTICEDIWREDLLKFLHKKANPQILINSSASPFFAGKFEIRKKYFASLARKFNLTILYCNLVGGQDELIFDGSSIVVDSQGRIILKAERFKEDLLIFDSQAKYQPLQTKIDKIEEIYQALILGIKDYLEKNNFKKAIVGVSGGIDSALTLFLAQKAIGRENVLALIMPSRFSSSETFNDAVSFVQKLGVKFHIIPIESIYSSYLDTVKPYLKDQNYKKDVTFQNIQARIRGNILMAFSNYFGYLVLNTGNKSEVSVGYCTLYGDTVGGFGVLKDVYKTEVYKLARFINRKIKKNIIPSSIIRRAPSAELKPNQKDEDDLPPYSLLDKILKLYIEEDKSLKEIISLEYKKNIVEKIVKSVEKSEYKRRQAPPGIKITPKAFGKDRHIPITNKFSP